MDGYFVTKKQPSVGGLAKISEPVTDELDGLDKAMIEACKLAGINEKDAKWKIVNDGSKPGSNQVYQLNRPDGSWSGYDIFGPYVGTGERT